MFKLYLITTEFLEKFVSKEIENLIDIKPKFIEECLFEIVFENKKSFLENTYKLIHFSRTIDYLFLEVTNFNDLNNIENINLENLSYFKKDFQFSIESFDDSLKTSNLNKISDLIEKNSNLIKIQKEQEAEIEFETFKIEKDYIIALNLFGSSLCRRDYMVNSYEDSINPLFVNYLLFTLSFNKLEKFSLIDTNAQLGDIVIEAALFTPRKPLFVKEKRSLPIGKIFGAPIGLTSNPKDNNKILGVVLDNTTFKYIKENISFSSQKIKLSSFDFDWLDVKFHKNDFDYLITQFPEFESDEEQLEYEKEFFYQAEFIIKNQICIFSKEELSLKELNKLKLKLISKENLEYEDESILLYIIEKISNQDS